MCASVRQRRRRPTAQAALPVEGANRTLGAPRESALRLFRGGKQKRTAPVNPGDNLQSRPSFLSSWRNKRRTARVARRALSPRQRARAVATSARPQRRRSTTNTDDNQNRCGIFAFRKQNGGCCLATRGEHAPPTFTRTRLILERTESGKRTSIFIVFFGGETREN